MTRNFAKDPIEGYQVEVCDLERVVRDLQNRPGVSLPVYQESNLPHSLPNGSVFLTDHGRFCLKWDSAMYCMPAERPVYGAIGPTLCAVDYETIATITPFFINSSDIWAPAEVNPDKSYSFLERPGAHNKRWTCINPVWNYAFDKIAYVTWGGIPTAGASYSSPQPPMYVAMLDLITNHETLIYEFTENAGKVCFSPDGKKLAFSALDTDDPIFQNNSQLLQNTRVYELETGIIHGPLHSSNYALFDWSKDSEYVYTDAGVYGDNSQIVANRWNDPDDWYVILDEDDTPDGNAWWTINTHPDGEHIVTSWYNQTGTGFNPMALIATDGSRDVQLIDVHDYDWPAGTTNPYGDEPYPTAPTQPFFRPDDPDWIIFDSEVNDASDSGLGRTWDAYALNYITGETKRWSIGDQETWYNNPEDMNPPYTSYAYAVSFGLDGVMMQTQDTGNPTVEDPGNGDLVAFDWDTGEGRRITENHIVVERSDLGNNYVGTTWYVWWHTGIPWQTYWSNNGAWG